MTEMAYAVLNSADPDQTAPNQGLHILQSHLIFRESNS